ncbi:hypothetical protein Dimus_004172, partial [Dionaea muscipula]
ASYSDIKLRAAACKKPTDSSSLVRPVSLVAGQAAGTGNWRAVGIAEQWSSGKPSGEQWHGEQRSVMSDGRRAAIGAEQPSISFPKRATAPGEQRNTSASS